MNHLSTLARNIALVVPTLNGGEVWERWLVAFSTQTLLPEFLLVMDSSSQDDTAALARAHGFEVHSIPRGDFDHGGTRQLAAEILEEAQIIIYMTQDAIPASPDALERLITAFEDPNVGAAYGRQLPRLGATPIEAHARLFNYPPVSEVRTLADIPRLGIRAAFMSDSFAAYRRAALMDVGGFPRRVILGEDTFVAAKMLLAGWKIAYRADAQVYHSHAYSPWQEFKRYFDIGVFHAREPWIRERFGEAEGEGWRYVRSELTYLLRENPLLIPSSLVRLPLKYLGYRLGKLEASLPRWLKKRLSMHAFFWDSEPR